MIEFTKWVLLSDCNEIGHPCLVMMLFKYRTLRKGCRWVVCDIAHKQLSLVPQELLGIVKIILEIPLFK